VLRSSSRRFSSCSSVAPFASTRSTWPGGGRGA
jgi:hypothetical protein